MYQDMQFLQRRSLCPFLPMQWVTSYYYGLYQDSRRSFCSGGVYVHFCQRSEKGWKRGAPPGLRGHLLPNLGEILEFRFQSLEFRVQFRVQSLVQRAPAPQSRGRFQSYDLRLRTKRFIKVYRMFHSIIRKDYSLHVA